VPVNNVFVLGRGLEGPEQTRYLQAHDAVLKAIETVLADGPRTADLGGQAQTNEIGDAVKSLLLSA